jgi:hypothetical protein
MDKIFTKTFHCKTLQNLPKFVLFGLKIDHLATLLATSKKTVGRKVTKEISMAVEPRSTGGNMTLSNKKREAAATPGFIIVAKEQGPYSGTRGAGS